MDEKKTSPSSYRYIVAVLMVFSLSLKSVSAPTFYSVNVSPKSVSINGEVSLSCKITDPSGFTVMWRKRVGGTLTEVGKAAKAAGCDINPAFAGKYTWETCDKPTSGLTREYILKIVKAEPADSTSWDCYDIGAAGPSETVRVKVEVPPATPTVTGLGKPVAENTEHTLTCDAHQEGVSDTITYTWYKDGVSTSKTGSKLVFKPVRRGDAGTYKCEAKNAVATKVSQELYLEVYHPPVTITLSATKSTRLLNEKETFTCAITESNPPNPLLTMYREKGGKLQILKGTRPTISLKDRTMVKDDNGAKFYCQSTVAGYPTVTKTSNEILYAVMYAHSVKLISNATSTTLVAGTTFTLTCDATGGNPSNVRQYEWTRNGKTQQSTSKTLYIHNVKYNEGGLYGCRATNDGGTGSDSMNITIVYPPMWNPALPKVLTSTAILDQDAKLTLHVIANPAATGITWYRYFGPKNYTNLDSNFIPKTINKTTYELVIKSVKGSYFGQYKAVVASQTGSSTFIFKLTAPGKPYSPCCLNVTMETSVSVTLTFTAGFYGGAPQKFFIESREENGDWRQVKANIKDPGTGRTATVKITDRRPSTRYDFRVYGENKYGRTKMSNTAGTKTDAAPPIDKKKISVIRKDTTITVTWPSLGRKYTRIDVKYCVISGENPGTCAVHNVEDTSAAQTTITVEKDNEYTYILRIYDSDDIVYISPALASRRELPIIIIAGGAAGGGLLLLIIIIVTPICVCKRRKARKQKSDIELHRVIKTSHMNANNPASPGASKKFHIFAKPHAKNTLRRKYQDSLVDNKRKKKGSMDIGRMNPGFEEEFRRHDEARKDSLASILDKGHFAYEDVSINNYCPKMTSTEYANAEVELRSPDSTNNDKKEGVQERLDLSALINKPSSASPLTVDLSKNSQPTANNLNGPAVVKIKNSDINKGPVYAEVDLNKKTNRPQITVDDVSLDGADPNQSFEIKIRVKVPPSPKPGGKDKPATAPKPMARADPEVAYENADIRTNVNKLNITPSDDGSYANIGNDLDGTYQEVGVGQAQAKPPMIGVDGTIYADVNLKSHAPSKPRVIRDSEPPSEYAQVDFSKTAPPMNGKIEEI